MEIGSKNRIKEIREIRGISAQKLADAVGSSQSVISKLENGNKKKIDPDLIQRIADYFNVSIDYLLGRTFYQTSLEDFWPEEGVTKNIVPENRAHYIPSEHHSDGYDEPLTEDEKAAVKAFLETYRKMKQTKKDQ